MAGSPRLSVVWRNGVTTCQARPTTSAAIATGARSRAARARARPRAAPGRRTAPRAASCCRRAGSAPGSESRSTGRRPPTRARRGRPDAAVAAAPARRTAPRPPGREPERELAALREQQTEDGQRARARAASRRAAQRPSRRSDDERQEGGRDRARERSGQRADRGRRAAPAARAGRRAPNATPSANTSQPLASSAAGRAPPNQRPAQRARSPQRSRTRRSNSSARDRRHGPDPDRRQQRRQRREQHAVGEQVVAAVPGVVPDREAVCSKYSARKVCAARSRSGGFQIANAPVTTAARAGPPSAEESVLHGGDPSENGDISPCPSLPRRGDHRPLLRAAGRAACRGRRVRAARRRRSGQRGRVAARCGAEASLGGGVGDDAWGDWLEERLRPEGVELDWFARIPGLTNAARIRDGERAAEPDFTSTERASRPACCL